jgi:hypothetical protein
VESVRNRDLHKGHRASGAERRAQASDRLQRFASERPGGARGRTSTAKAAEQTTFATTPDSVIVSIDELGFRQRFEGGTINAPGEGWLTIPARSEAHGHRAREFNDLRFVQIRFWGGRAGPGGSDKRIKRGKKGPSGRAPFRSGGEVGGLVDVLVGPLGDAARGSRVYCRRKQELIAIPRFVGRRRCYELVTETGKAGHQTMSPLEQIQSDIAARLNSLAYFVDVPAFVVREQKVDSMIEQALTAVSQKNGKSGVAAKCP